MAPLQAMAAFSFCLFAEPAETSSKYHCNPADSGQVPSKNC